MKIIHQIEYTVPIKNGYRYSCKTSVIRNKRLTTKGLEKILRKSIPNAVVTSMSTTIYS
jgi:hypothetical protein